MTDGSVKEIDFGKLGGVVPVVVQDATTREVLMVAFMNRDAYMRTVETGFMWYFSRKRHALWKKGEQSGHFQRLVRLYLDCDNDSLLAEVEQTGGACDLGYRSCFDKRLSDGQEFIPVGETVFDPAVTYAKYEESIRLAVPTGSLESCTRQLLGLALHVETPGEGEFLRARLPSHGSRLTCFGHDPREIPALLAHGTYDAGITGFDIVLEADSQTVPVSCLRYNKRGRGPAVWAVAVPESSPVVRLHDLQGQTVVSELRAVTAAFFARLGIKVDVVASTGENANLFTGQAVVDLIETGGTLKRFGYRPVAAVLETHAVLVACPASYGYTWKRRSIEALSSALSAVVDRLPASDKTIYAFPPDSASPAASSTAQWEAFRTAWFTRYGDEVA